MTTAWSEDDAPKPTMTLSEYAAKAAETAVFPGEGTFWGLQYVTSGLANEAGEVLGKIKKMQRDGGYAPESTLIYAVDLEALKSELGDVAWYFVMSCREAAINPDDVLRANLEKLADRRERGVLGGSGDER